MTPYAHQLLARTPAKPRAVTPEPPAIDRRKRGGKRGVVGNRKYVVYAKDL